MEKHNGIKAKKSLGQNFLNNSNIPRAMADAASIVPSDIILEIGPGTGALTKELLLRSDRVIAIETDSRAIEVLNHVFAEEIQSGKLTLISGDVRSCDLTMLGIHAGAYKLVANIPYYLSGFLFRTFLEHTVQPSTIVFLVQKEVAERIARDKKESLLSLSVKAYGTPHYIQTVKKGNFTPQPKIDSAIIAITGISKKRLNGVSEMAFFTLLHEGFKSRRKQLLGNLSTLYGREAVVRALTTLTLPLNVRAEDLPLAIWISLAQHLEIPIEKTENTQS